MPETFPAVVIRISPRVLRYAQVLRSSGRQYWGRRELLDDMERNGLPPVQTFNTLVRLKIIQYIKASSEESIGCYEVLTKN